ncbi:hypothetical protein [Candidatus Uabimicrobium amorphum]|nr:hypothetical protein [Candidatus Uabimicrobium amorphum]
MTDIPTTLPLTNITFIKKNPYCSIYRAQLHKEIVFVKHYIQQQETLVPNEAKSIELYQKITHGENIWSECTVIECDPPKGLLVVSFVPGDSLSRCIYSCKNKPQLLQNVVSLGKLLGSLYNETKREGTIDPFFYEYIEYCQQKLQNIHGIPGCLSKRYHLLPVEKVKENCISFSHGDFVPANIHLHNEKVGLIDFANSNDCSHIENDIMNFTIAINNMFIKSSLKKEILQAFHEGIGERTVFPQTKNLFRTFHYCRWIMLNIHSKNPFRLFNVWKNAQRFQEIE